MSYFMKRNMDALRAQVIAADSGSVISARFAAPNIRVLYPNEYIVSNGSLAPFVNPVGNIIDPENEYPGLSFPIALTAQTTLSDFMSAIGASAGEQLTFLFFNTATDGKDFVAKINDEKAYATALAVRRLKFLDSYSVEELETPIFENGQWKSMFDPAVSDSDINLKPDVETKALYVTVPSFKGKRNNYGGCCIRSRKNGESWLRSPQKVYVSSDYLSSDRKPGFSVTTAYNAWTSGTTAIGVSEYILNGKPNTDVWPIIDEDEP
jgi:hypothetical protein